MVKKWSYEYAYMCMQIRTAIIEKPYFFNIWKTMHDNIMKMVSTHVSMVKDYHNVTYYIVVCVCACVRARVRACVRARVRACMYVYITQQPLESIIFIYQRENNTNKNDAEEILNKNNKRS